MKVAMFTVRFRSVWSGPLTVKEEWSRAQWRGKSDVTKPGIVLTDYLVTLSLLIAKQRQMGRSSNEW
jgi:hypothetical protein